MLVLKRKVGEYITIGDEVVLHVRRIDGNSVSIGVEAPRQVLILRGEVVPHSTVVEDAEPLAQTT